MDKFKARFDKRMKMISIGFILGGIIACGIGFALVDFDIYQLNPEPATEFVVREQGIPLQDLKSIDIDVHQMDVTIERVEGDLFLLQYEEDEETPMKIDASKSSLSIKQQRDIQFFQFNWMNIENRGDAKLKLQIPKDYVGDLFVSNGFGTININDIKDIKELSIENEHGEMELNDVEASNISLTNAFGSITANNLISKSDITIENEHDDIELRNVQASNFYGDMYFSEINIDTMTLEKDFNIVNEHGDMTLSNVVSKRSHAEVSFGSISLRNWLSDDITMDVEHGNINGDLVGKEEDYHIISDVENGENNLANERNVDKIKQLNITLSYGDVDINFI